MLTIKLTVLEFKDDEYQGIKYSNIHGRYNGKIIKFKLDRNKVGNISNMLDKNVEADIEIVSGTNLAATLKIVAVREA
jgi:hypothetical protein